LGISGSRDSWGAWLQRQQRKALGDGNVVPVH
jgi:hypothetical protein